MTSVSDDEDEDDHEERENNNGQETPAERKLKDREQEKGIRGTLLCFVVCEQTNRRLVSGG